MPKFMVSAKVTVSAYTYVDADSEDEAIEIASTRSASLCPDGASRSGVDDHEEFVIADADGDPANLRAEKR